MLLRKLPSWVRFPVYVLAYLGLALGLGLVAQVLGPVLDAIVGR